MVRLSRVDDAITVRTGLAGEQPQLVRVVPFDANLDARAGPFVCAPTRAGLVMPFHGWRRTALDRSLHP